MKWLHFVGIGGAGMSGIANVFLNLGYKVSGSDLKSSHITKRLEENGAKIFLGHHKDNVPKGIDIIIISSAIPQDNEEILQGKKLNIPIVQRAQMLAKLMERQKSICVAGAHGKTTTTSMIALVLEKNNLDPTIVIGGELNDIGGNAKLGKGEYMIAEADESDGSFLKLLPWSNIITNIEDDHLDYYGSVDNIINAFRDFVALGSRNGYTVLCAEDSLVMKLKESVPGKLLTYGFIPEADYRAKNIEYVGLKTISDIYYKDEFLGKLELSIPGKHNILNALATIVMCRELGINFQDITCALKGFCGAKRRFQFIGDIRGVKVYDDYAHHPTEIKATLQAARNSYSGRIIAVFQPHRYSRTKWLAEEFGKSFQDADKVILTDIYSAGEKPIHGITSQIIADYLPEDSDVEIIKDINNLPQFLFNLVRPNDLVLTLGAGDIDVVGRKLVQILKE